MDHQYIKICARHGTLIALHPDEALPDPIPKCVACKHEEREATHAVKAKMGQFPIMLSSDPKQRATLIAAGCPEYVPWALISKHKFTLNISHQSDMLQLVERGGLGIAELVRLLEDKLNVRHVPGMSDLELVPHLLELLAEAT